MLTCLDVVERFRNSGIGTRLLHNAMLSGVRTSLIPAANVRMKTFFLHRGWCAVKETPAKGGNGISRKEIVRYGIQNQKLNF